MYSQAGASNTSVLAFGGGDGPTRTAATEDWNGASWVETSDLNTAVQQAGGAGTSSAAFSAGGINPSGGSEVTVASTEEWSSTSETIKVLTD